MRTNISCCPVTTYITLQHIKRTVQHYQSQDYVYVLLGPLLMQYIFYYFIYSLYLQYFSANEITKTQMALIVLYTIPVML